MANEVNLLSDRASESKLTKSSDASDALIEAALTFYPCKNGALVTNPRDCDGTMMSFGELTIDDLRQS